MDSRVELTIDGMSCQACVQGLTKKLSSVAGVSSATVDLAAGKAVVRHNEATATIDDLIAAVEQLGFHATPFTPPGA
jgi:copper chaperone CopZ